MQNNSVSKASVAEIIAGRFIAELRRGVAPWARGFVMQSPRNAVSGKEYRGVNWWLLSMLGVDYAATFNQVKNAGGTVNKGAKGIPVVLWKPLEKETVNASGVKVREKAGMMMRYFTVFSVNDTTGFTFKRHDATPGAHLSLPDAMQSFLSKAQSVCGFTLKEGGNQPCFVPSANRIEMPPIARWHDATRYAKTLAHEIGHALGKVTGKEFKFDRAGESYSTEELTAELFASCVLSHLGLESAGAWDNSVAYVQGWASKLSDEPQAIISAAQEAQKRFDLIFPRAVETESGD